MNKISRWEPQTESIARFQSLLAGQYWRAVSPIPEEGIDEGTVLLVQSIRWVDGAAHTIILRPHPSKLGKRVQLTLQGEDGKKREVQFVYDEHRFLLDRFLELFEFEPDAQQIRAAELKQVQQRVVELQSELVQAQTDPGLLAAVVSEKMEGWEASQEDGGQPAEKGQETSSTAILPCDGLRGDGLLQMAGGTVAEAIGEGITPAAIASLRQAARREHQVATIKAEWIQGKTREISATLDAMTPYFSEQAAAALAQTEDVRAHVEKLMAGIGSLDLYVGKDVTVTTIRSGASAPANEPLTLLQRKYVLEEELAVWADVDESFDFQSVPLFDQKIRENDDLLEQIFPAKRCVLVMAVNRRYIDYGDGIVNQIRNEENHKVFLLVRDGENVHRVVSPVETHLKSARLFPSRSEHDGLFAGVDGSQIRFEDVAYTEALARHERHALHYKRFLILLAGLDHRLKLFGDFYEGPQSLRFVSQAFQDQHFRFIHDDDGAGLLPGETRKPLREWIADQNAQLRSGSRVLCNWRSLLNPTTAPGACKVTARGERFERRYSPGNRFDVLIAYRDKDEICVDVEVRGFSASFVQRRFMCKVGVSRFRSGYWDHSDLPYLCLDTVRPEDLRWYIHSRKTREMHLDYIRCFKLALRFIENERQQEAGARTVLHTALKDGGIATGKAADELVDQAVAKWRAANRGRPLPPLDGDEAPAVLSVLLNQMFMLAGEGRERAAQVEAFLRERGLEPLRLALSGDARFVAYAAPRPDQRDDRVEPHRWVHRIVLHCGKQCSERSRSWTIFPKVTPAETPLHEWPEAENWAATPSSFGSPERKKEVFGLVDSFAESIVPFVRGMTAEEFSTAFGQWKALRGKMLDRSASVQNPHVALPFAVAGSSRSGKVMYLCLFADSGHALLDRFAPSDAERALVRNEFVRVYRHRSKGGEIYDSDVRNTKWLVAVCPFDQFDNANGPFVSDLTGIRSMGSANDLDPRLNIRIAKWREVDGSGMDVWFPPNLAMKDGIPMVDELLGINLPEDFEPTKVFDMALMEGDGRGHTHWFILAPFAAEFPSLREMGVSYYSYRTEQFATRADARRFIVRRAISLTDGKREAIDRTGLDSSPTFPEKFELWCIEGTPNRDNPN